MEWKELQTLVKRNIGYGIVQPGPSVPKGVPIIKVNNIISGLYDTKHLDKTTVDNDAKYQRTKLKGGELIVTVVGTCGKTAIVPIHFAGCNLVRATCLIDIEDETICRWIKYYIDSPYGQAYINRNLNTTVQATLNVKNLNEMPIPFYSDEYTLNVVKILSSLDRKIELNNKINADLEEMAQAIFKNWFVDFEPFKDGKFVDSELGMIPEGWKVGTIGDIVEFQNGFTFSSKDFSENGEYKIITIKSVQDGCLVTEGSSKVTEYPTKMPAYCKLQSGDILLSLTGNVGRCCLVTETNLLLNQRVAKIKAKECYDNSFSYALFRLKETKELLISISRGTAQANLSPVEASKLPMVIPSEDARKSFSMISDSIMNKIISIHIENSRLSLLRDTLLPRLMSGELEVPE